MPDRQHLALGHLGQHPQRQPPGLLGQPARELGRQRVPGLAGRVARADQRRAPGCSRATPPTRRAHRSASRPAGPQVELLGRQPGGGAVGRRPPSAISPADSATSTISAAPASSTCSSRATALRSRTARPPLRSTLGGCTPQWSSSSSTRRTTSKAAPAAVRATSAGSRDGRGQAAAPRRPAPVVVRPPRSARPTSPGRTTVSPSRGTSRRRLISSSAGRRGLGGGDRAPRRSGRALAAVGVDVAQQRGRGRGSARRSARPPRPGARARGWQGAAR